MAFRSFECKNLAQNGRKHFCLHFLDEISAGLLFLNQKAFLTCMKHTLGGAKINISQNKNATTLFVNMEFRKNRFHLKFLAASANVSFSGQISYPSKRRFGVEAKQYVFVVPWRSGSEDLGSNPARVQDFHGNHSKAVVYC
jgi:hypothetical protein